MSNFPKSKTKIVVRIRTIKEEKKTSSSYKSSLAENKTNPSVNKSTSSNKTTKSSVKTKKLDTEESKSYLNPNASYTIFTSIERSNICVVTSNAIKGKLIQDTFQSSNEIYDYSVNLMNDASILEFDSVYNERNRLDQLYLEQIKEPISDMLSGKNSCIMVFGPSEGGKSYTFRGGENEKGLIDRAVDDLFNYIEINQQVNQGKQNRSINTFRLKIMIYQVFNENIYDLLSSSSKPNPLKIEKTLITEDSDYYTTILDLTQKELKSRKDLMNAVNEALKIRKNQAQLMQVNNLNKKSHLITSLILEKINKFKDTTSKTNEIIIEKYSQVDFVELANSEYGLTLSDVQRKKLTTKDIEKKGKSDNVNKLYNESIEDTENKIIEKSFNSICDNIIALNNNLPSKSESKLTLCLKPTLNKKSNIILILCVLPNENPPIYSLKSLKYGNWLRNQISNFESNTENHYKSNNMDDSNVEVEPDVIEYTKGNKYQNIYKNHEIKDHKFDIHHENEENTGFYKSSMTNKNDQINNRYKYGSEHNNDFSQSRYNKEYEDHVLNNSNSRNPNNFYETNENYKHNHDKIKYNRIHDLESSRRSPIDERRDNESYLKLNKSYEKKVFNNNFQKGNTTGSKDKRDFYKINSQTPNLNILNNSELINKNIFSENNMNDSQDYRKEYMIIKSDLIIYKEQNTHLMEVNNKLQAEIECLTSKINSISTENTILTQDKIHKQQEIERLTNNIIRGGDSIFNSSFQNKEKNKFTLDAHLTLTNKIRELEGVNKDLYNEKQRLDIDFKVVSQRYNELKQTYDALESSFNTLKNRQIEEMDQIENKLERMCKELEYIQKENISLKSNEERLKNHSSNFERKFIKKSDKYRILKENYEILLAKYKELEGRVYNDEIRRSEDIKRNKTENKKNILDEMQNKLQSLKRICKERNKTVDE